MLIWNSVAQFVAQCGWWASLEYGNIISGTVWWMCQFEIRSHFWHSSLVVPFCRHFFCHRVDDLWYYNRLDGVLAREDGNGVVGVSERFIAAGSTCQRAFGVVKVRKKQ